MYRDGSIVDVNHAAGFSLNESVRELLKLIVNLVMDTPYFKKETKAVLMGNSYRSSGDASINTNTIKSRVSYDFQKLSRVLGVGFFDTILRNQEMDLSSYTDKINELLGVSSKKSILDTLAIKLPKSSGKEIKSIETRDWKFIYSVIFGYSKQYIHQIEKKVTDEMVSYIEYLENHTDSLNAEQQEQYESLQKLMAEGQV
jgi:hypothetical protein